MSDSRELRIAELKRLLASAQESVQQLSEWRLVINAMTQSSSEKNTGVNERVWIVQAIDNRRALMNEKINQFTRGIEQAYENAQPEVGALFIDGRQV